MAADLAVYSITIFVLSLAENQSSFVCELTFLVLLPLFGLEHHVIPRPLFLQWCSPAAKSICSIWQPHILNPPFSLRNPTRLDRNPWCIFGTSRVGATRFLCQEEGKWQCRDQ